MSSELVFYGGIAMMIVAGVIAVVAMIAFHIAKKRLDKHLEQEFGKKKN